MGQTVVGFAGCGCASHETCTVTVARHLLESEPPFGKVDMANCMLLRASKDGDIEGIEDALDDGANIDTRLPMWIRIGQDEGVFHAQSADVETPNQTALTLTPLMHAAQEGHVEAVEYLLRRGANVDLHEADGMQALHFAALSASAGCFRILIGAGANPLAMDNFGRDALQCALLSQIAASPSKHEWLELFRLGRCWSESVHDNAKKNGCGVKLHEEASEDSISTVASPVERHFKVAYEI
jgi:hypothetical protein